MLGKPTSPERLQLAPGGRKQLHPTKTELSWSLGSRKADRLTSSSEPSLPPFQTLSPALDSAHPSIPMSRPPGARAPPLRAAGRREEELARRRRGCAGRGAGGQAARPDFSCDTHSEQRRVRGAWLRTRSAVSCTGVGGRTLSGSTQRRRRKSWCSFGGRISPPLLLLLSSPACSGRTALSFPRRKSRHTRCEPQGTGGRPQQSDREVGRGSEGRGGSLSP